MRILATTTLIILLLWANSCQAEPSRETRYLINNPVSLLELGVKQIKVGLERLFDEESIAVAYSWESDLIMISIESETITIFKSKEALNRWCARTTERIAAVLLKGPGNDNLAKYFSINGNFYTNPPVNIWNNLARIITVDTTGSFKEEEEELLWMTCTGGLFSDSMRYCSKPSFEKYAAPPEINYNSSN